MKKIILVIVLILAFPYIAKAENEWTTTDKVLFGTFVTLHAVDYAQTRYIVKHSDKYKEGNFLLGSKPSQEIVDGVFLGTLAVIGAASYYLPEKERRYLLSIASMLKVAVVSNNFSIGVGMSF